MGGRGTSSGGGGWSIGVGGGGGAPTAQILTQPPNILPTQQQAQQANQRQFPDTDNRPYHDLKNGKNYYLSQNLTIDEQIAVANYLSDGKVSGTLYSMSQNMNHKLAHDLPLTANEQYVYKHMMSSMHNLGENVHLTRYDHASMVNELLRQSGVNKTYDKMQLSDIKKALVGQTFGENRIISTSYNDFKNAPQKSKDTFTTRAVKLSYNAKANVQAMMTGNGAGGALGEVVLAPSGKSKNFKVVDVKWTGSKARSQGTQNYNLPQIELVVEATKQG